MLGDFNLDGSVNAADLDNLAVKWRESAAIWTGGDFTADGVVDPRDLNALAINWQESIPVASTANGPVPEPSAVLLMAAGLALVWRRRVKLSSIP